MTKNSVIDTNTRKHISRKNARAVAAIRSNFNRLDETYLAGGLEGKAIGSPGDPLDSLENLIKETAQIIENSGAKLLSSKEKLVQIIDLLGQPNLSKAESFERAILHASSVYNDANETAQAAYTMFESAKRAYQTEPKAALDHVCVGALLLARSVALLSQRDRSKGGAKKQRNDPKQAAKLNAYALWQARRSGKHPELRTNEMFSIEAMRRWPVLTSAKVICGWCTDWEKDAKDKRKTS